MHPKQHLAQSHEVLCAVTSVTTMVISDAWCLGAAHRPNADTHVSYVYVIVVCALTGERPSGSGRVWAGRVRVGPQGPRGGVWSQLPGVDDHHAGIHPR
jgi:hypothetical protein